MMPRPHKRKALMLTVGAVLVGAAGVAALAVTRDGSDDDVERSGGSGLTTTPVAQRELAEYLEITGTLDYADSVTLAAQSSGVLVELAPEGAVVAQGEQLYLILNDPTAAETANVLAQLESAQNALLTAENELSDALAGPSESDVAAASAVLAEAVETRDRLAEPPSAVETETAEAAVLSAEETLDTLENPTEAVRAAARTQVGTGRAELADLLEGPTQAETDAAEASVLVAEEALADLLAGPTQAELDTARADVLAAEDALDYYDPYHPYDRYEPEIAAASADLSRARDALGDLVAGATQAEVDSAEAAVLVAREALADLVAGVTQAEVDSAEAAVLVAREALADLVAGATQAEIDSAEAAVLSAEESLDVLENPTEAALAAARTQLADAREALTDLLAGATQAEMDTAEAAVLVAQEALVDLLTGPTPQELVALEQSVASAQAALVSAESDYADLSDGYSSRVVMYGDTPVHRTMAVGLEGDDIRLLEQNLADLGYGAGESLLVDGVFDEATVAAVRAWQEPTGRRVDATVGPHDVLFLPGPVQVGSWAAGIEVGQDLAAGTILATVTAIQAPVNGEMSTTQRVVASLSLSDRDLLSEGVTVNVELPDNSDVAGTVTAINPAPVLDASTGDNIVEVTIVLREPASEVWIGASVDVEITETLIEDALVVPATALLALTEGGYAVEILDDDGSTRLLGVDPGLFVDGDVEVRGPGLAVGMRVVIPR